MKESIGQSYSSDHVKWVISKIVKANKIDEYEEWIKGINQQVSHFDGFLGVDVIRPRTRELSEYVIILRFDSFTNLRKWQQSPIRLAWLKESRGYVISETQTQKTSGLEMYFTLPNYLLSKSNRPAYYKLVIIGILAVYPLIIFINFMIDPLVNQFSDELQIFFSVIFVSMIFFLYTHHKTVYKITFRNSISDVTVTSFLFFKRKKWLKWILFFHKNGAFFCF